MSKRDAKNESVGTILREFGRLNRGGHHHENEAYTQRAKVPELPPLAKHFGNNENCFPACAAVFLLFMQSLVVSGQVW